MQSKFFLKQVQIPLGRALRIFFVSRGQIFLKAMGKNSDTFGQFFLPAVGFFSGPGGKIIFVKL